MSSSPLYRQQICQKFIDAVPEGYRPDVSSSLMLAPLDILYETVFSCPKEYVVLFGFVDVQLEPLQALRRMLQFSYIPVQIPLSLVERFAALLLASNSTVVHKEVLELLAGITGRGQPDRIGVLELMSQFLGRPTSDEATVAALKLVSFGLDSAMVGLNPGFKVEDYPDLWKKLSEESLKEHSTEVDKRLLYIWVRLRSENLPTVLAHRKSEIYKKFCLFKGRDELAATFIQILTQVDDEMIEVGISKGLLNILAADLKKKTVSRATVIGIIHNIMCSRPMYLKAVLDHPLIKLIKSQLIKRRVTCNGILLAIAVIKSCRIATKELVLKMIQEDLLHKALYAIHYNRSRQRYNIASDSDYVIKKLRKLARKEKRRGIEMCYKELKEILEHQVLQRDNNRINMLFL
eukprot:TRINITY_DN2610_c0_g1_i1.p1 TRINITY_DN2610_c0_g1~~TRINITY_DN2610_c0_g1_i1.p1  ORF type:complete len:405 (+),score=34.46 TRINITY_DN2610_c0_g1_i1:294-1508(+)